MTSYLAKFLRRIRRNSIPLVAALAIPPVVAPGNADAQTVLTVTQSRDPQNLDPIDTFRVACSSVASSIFDGLVLRNEDLELAPGLAPSREFLDDDTRIRFHLRECVVFQNGEPFNAEAVRCKFQRLLREVGTAGPQRANYTSIEAIEVVDDYTVDFVMNQPDSVLITKLSG
ncbi:ABC transporter substrate-binding protein [Ruegeria sp. 2205SS24-7]|uniref:ABC transporter substrate-binding protein n=1 Tax=Ruegeria discodermiae TaxID=3064389 RepID=UPI0027420920|nr:ABC transporter substrate-binding protein [Ruegeria sp. 2205SS24-7]MDP5217301.1 ABC transporter substrate-binding protein [Ruegeria sp. 2205SS24-7]